MDEILTRPLPWYDGYEFIRHGRLINDISSNDGSSLYCNCMSRCISTRMNVDICKTSGKLVVLFDISNLGVTEDDEFEEIGDLSYVLTFQFGNGDDCHRMNLSIEYARGQWKMYDYRNGKDIIRDDRFSIFKNMENVFEIGYDVNTGNIWSKLNDKCILSYFDKIVKPETPLYCTVRLIRGLCKFVCYAY